ncbi:hypothetical protein IPG36_05350 [bacterium]|nr:MAG: hypothetical protein IPG36_05350 [bacterium]
MANSLITLAAIKAFYEAQNDFISAFSYFVPQVLDQDGQTLEEIRAKVRDQFSMDIPEGMLKTLVKRLKSEGDANFDNLNSGQIHATAKGKAKIDEIKISLRASERESQALIIDIKRYAEAMVEGKNILKKR